MPTMKTAFIEYQDDEEQVSEFFASEVAWPVDGNYIRWTTMDDDEDRRDRAVEYLSVTADGGAYNLVLRNGGTAHVRALDPYDGVKRSAAQVPQPIDVLQAEALRGGGVVAQELVAVVAPDNTVVTLMLETGIGLYVRFSGDWQLLSSDSVALDDMQLLPVSPASLAVFDAADMANSTLSAFDLPRVETFDNGVQVEVLPEPVGLQTGMPDMGGAVVASGVVIPTVDTVDDLDVAIRVASANPGARWFVAKRAKALGAEERVPADWLPRAVVHPFLT